MELPYLNYLNQDTLLEIRGYKLEQMLKVDHSGNMNETINHFLNEVASTIYNLILEKTHNREYAKMLCTDEEFKEILENCQLEQCVYILDNGNLLGITGTGSQLIDINELRRKRAYAPIVISELEASHLFYSGLD